jgi:hypothetical protein
MFVTAIMRKYCESSQSKLKVELPWVFLETTREQYERKVLNRMLNLHSIGIDMSKFDKRHSATILSWTLRILFKHTMMPQAVQEFMIKAICKGTYVLPDGTSVLINGTNPSGNYLTSWNNTITHRIYNLFLFSLILDCPVAEVDTRVVSVCTSDDGIDGFKAEADCRKVADEIKTVGDCWFRINFKVARMVGDSPCHPPGILPVYLSNVLVKRGDSYIPIPADFRKRLCKLQFQQGKPSRSDWLRVAMGILSSANGFFGLKHLDRNYRWPQSFQMLYDDLLAASAEVEALSLGRVPTAEKFDSFTESFPVCF